MKRKKLRLTQTEALALLEYLVAESVASQKEFHYRLKVPYQTVTEHDQTHDSALLVIDFSIYFDGELYDTNDPGRKFKITGPNKDRH